MATMERQMSLFCLEKARETTNPINCCKCGNTCFSFNDLETHISVEHLNFSPYECVFCPNELPIRLATEHNLRTHVNLFHPEKDCKILFKADDEYGQKKSKLLRLLEQSLMPTVVPEDFAAAAATSSAATTSRLRMVLPNLRDSFTPPPPTLVAMKSSSSLNLSMDSDKGDTEGRPRTLLKALPVASTPLRLTERNQMDDANTLVASLFHQPMDALSTSTSSGDRLTCAVCEEEMGKKDVVIHVRKHMSREANREGRSDSFFTMRPDFIAQHNFCFPGLLRKKSLTCVMCRAMVPKDYSSKRVHIFRCHLNIPVYQCSLCNTGFNKLTRKRLAQHFSSRHKDAKPEAINNVKQHEAKFGELMQRCFQRTALVRQQRRSSRTSVSMGSVDESPAGSVAVAGLCLNSTDLGAEVENSSTLAPILAVGKRAHCTLCNTSCPAVKKRDHVLKCHLQKPVMFCPFPGCDWKSLFVNYTGYYYHRNCHRGFSEPGRNESHKFNDEIDHFFSVCFGGKKCGGRNVPETLRQCRECHMQLYSESEIDEHPWVHVNEPLFECSVCSYHSRSPSGLPDVEAHMQSVHQGGRLPPPAEDLRDMHRHKYELWRRKCFDVMATPPSTSAAASGAGLSSKPSEEIRELIYLD